MLYASSPIKSPFYSQTPHITPHTYAASTQRTIHHYPFAPTVASARHQVTSLPLLPQALFRRFYSTYPRVEHFMETTRASARRNGYVRTILGRVRHIVSLEQKPCIGDQQCVKC